MKIFSIVSALFSSAFALSSSTAFASSEHASASACAQAFAAQLAPSSGAVPNYKLEYEAATPSSVTAEYFASRYTFEMSARQPGGVDKIARATCVTSRSGKVISLTSLPVVTESSELAARL